MERIVREIRKDISDLGLKVADRTDAIDKTLDAASQLARSMEELVVRQRRRERLLQANSFVAYLGFTVLLGAAFWVLYNSRANDLVMERNAAVKDLAAAREQARRLQDSQHERQAAEKAAIGFYELVRTGRNSEIIDGYDAISKMPLSAAERTVFEDSLKRAQSEIIDAGYLAGVQAHRRGDYETAVAEFRRGLAYGDVGERVPEMRYFLGVGLHHQGNYEEAVRQFELALAGRVEEEGFQDVRFQLAAALMELGKLDEARAALGTFVARFPGHRLAPLARRRIGQILRASRPQGVNGVGATAGPKAQGVIPPRRVKAVAPNPAAEAGVAPSTRAAKPAGR